MKKHSTSVPQQDLTDLLLQALETENCGVELYRTALHCAVDPELKKEWQEYVERSQKHRRILIEVLDRLDVDPNVETPARAFMRQTGEVWVAAMETVLESGRLEEAQIVAAECVIETENQAHMNWESIGEAGKEIKGEPGEILREAHELVVEQNKHLYYTMGCFEGFGSRL